MAARSMTRAREIADTLNGVKCICNDATKPESFHSAYTTGQILTVSESFWLATQVYGNPANKTSRR